jgi:hypothetical protein
MSPNLGHQTRHAFWVSEQECRRGSEERGYGLASRNAVGLSAWSSTRSATVPLLSAYARVETWAVICSLETAPFLTSPTRVVRKSGRVRVDRRRLDDSQQLNPWRIGWRVPDVLLYLSSTELGVTILHKKGRRKYGLGNGGDIGNPAKIVDQSHQVKVIFDELRPGMWLSYLHHGNQT